MLGGGRRRCGASLSRLCVQGNAPVERCIADDNDADGQKDKSKCASYLSTVPKPIDGLYMMQNEYYLPEQLFDKTL